MDLLASNILDINDFIGFIYFYFPSAISFFYYYLYFASSFQQPFIFIPPYYVPNSFEIDGQSHIYKAFYFLIFLINGFTKLNVTGLQIWSNGGRFGLITSAFGGGGGISLFLPQQPFLCTSTSTSLFYDYCC